MSIFLVMPPQYSPICPTLAIPSLLGHLRLKGYIAKGFDLNIEACHYILSKSNLLKAKTFIDRKYDELIKKDELAPQDLEYYKLILYNKLMSSFIIEDSQKAILVIKNKDQFKDYKQYNWAMEVLQKAMTFGMAPYHPTNIWMFDAKTEYSILSVKDIIKAAKYKEDFYVEFYQDFISKVKEEKPKVISISVNVQNQIVPGMILAGMVKDLSLNIKILIGGSFISENSNALKKERGFFDYIDGICVNEGEVAMEKYMEYINGKCNISEVPNLIYMEDNEQKENRIELIQDLNLLAIPDFSDFDLDLYFSPERMLPLQTSRGCYWRRCVFCFHYYSYGQFFREKKAERIYDEMRIMKDKYNVSNFYFVDEAVSTQMFRNLSKIILNNDLEVYWGSAARLEKQMDLELCKQMHKAGCIRLEFGIESGSQRILDLMDKGITVDVIKRVLKNCYDAGISQQAYIVVGFPTEGEEEFNDTCNLLEHIKEYVDTIGYMNFDLGKYSRIVKEKEKYSITKIYENPPEQELVISYSKFDIEEGFSQQKAVELVDYLYASGPGTDRGDGTYFYTLPEWHNFLYIKYHKIKALRELINRLDEDVTNSELPESLVVNSDVTYSPFNLEDVDKVTNYITQQSRKLERTEGCNLIEAIKRCYGNVNNITKNEKMYIYVSKKSKLIEVPSFIIESCSLPSTVNDILKRLEVITNYKRNDIEQYILQLYNLGILIGTD